MKKSQWMNFYKEDIDGQKFLKQLSFFEIALRGSKREKENEGI